MHMKKLLLASLLCGSVLAAQADVVAKIGSNEYPSLSDALGAATGGQVVILQKDVTDRVTLAAGVNAILDLNGHSIDGGSDPQNSITNGPVLSVYGKLTLKDSGVGGMIKNGFENCHNFGGGGVSVQSGGSFTFESGIISNCYAAAYMSGSNCNNGQGGAICVRNGATFKMNGGTIVDCHAACGGAIGNKGAVEITSGTIKNCVADGSGLSGWIGIGGAIFNKGGSLTLNGGTLENNRGGDGGAIYNDSGTLTISSATIIGNTAGAWGGAIYTKDTTTISGGDFKNNSATSGGGAICALYQTTTISGGSFKENASYCGGAIYACLAPVTLSNVDISNNSATAYAGGIYVYGGTVTVNSGSSIAHNKVTNSTMANYGGGVYITNSGNVEMNGGSIEQNFAKNGGGVYIYSGYFTLNGGTIEHNSSYYAGGVYNGGVVYLNGGTIKDNTSSSYDTRDNIYCGYTTYVHLSKKPQCDSIYLVNTSAEIKIDGQLEDGSDVKFFSQTGARTITSGWSTYNSGVDWSTKFSTLNDSPFYLTNKVDNTEVILTYDYTVNFEANGGENTMDSQTKTYLYKQALSSNAFTRAGYNFDGWKDNSSGNSYTDGQTGDFGNASAGKTNYTLTAQWALDPTSSYWKAKVGDNYYPSFADAVDAVSAGGTITFLQDVTNDCLSVTNNCDFTVDFNGHTYTVKGDGSGFNLSEGQTITFKNGTIKVDGSSNIDPLIENHATLTLVDMTIEGGNISCDDGKVSVVTTSITGDIELSGGDLELTSGTLNGSLTIGEGLGDGVVTKSDTFDAAAPAGYEWVNNQLQALVVTFDALGGTFANGAETMEKNIPDYSTIDTIAPTRTDYTFLGWYKSWTNNVGQVTTATTFPGESHTLYAQWASEKPTPAADGSMALNDEDENGEPITEVTTDDGYVGNRTITRVSLPVYLYIIGDKAFYNCSNLKSVKLVSPRDINDVAVKVALRIGKYAFSGTALTKVVIPKGTSTIDSCAFAGCPYLTDITILGQADFTTAGPFRMSGVKNSQGGMITLHLAPRAACDADYMYSLTNGLTNVTIANDVAGKVDYTGSPIVDTTEKTAKFTFESSKDALKADVTALYWTSLGDLSAGAGTLGEVQTIEKNDDGSYTATFFFDGGLSDTGFFQVSVFDNL